MPFILTIVLVIVLFYFEINVVPASIIWIIWFAFGFVLFRAGVNMEMDRTMKLIKTNIIKSEFKKLEKDNEISND